MQSHAYWLVKSQQDVRLSYAFVFHMPKAADGYVNYLLLFTEILLLISKDVYNKSDKSATKPCY